MLHWAGGAHRCGMLAGGDRTAPPTACRHTLGSPENREDVMAFGERILGSNRALISSIGELCRKDLARGQPGRLAGCAVIARTPCRILMSAAVSARRLHQPLDLRRWHCPTPQSAGGNDCVAGHVGLELRNVGKNYPFERSRRFSEIQPNSGPRDYSRLSCGGGETQLGISAGISAGFLARALGHRGASPTLQEFLPIQR